MKGNVYPGEAEKITFGDGLPGYVVGDKGGPAVIVIQARFLAARACRVCPASTA